MICRARGCLHEAMPMSADNPKGLCGACHESDEEKPVSLKQNNQHVNAETVAKRNATSAANREAKAAHYAEIKARSLA